MTMRVQLSVAEHVAILTLNRPEVYNALDLPTAKELVDQLMTIRADPTVHSIILMGAGGTFFLLRLIGLARAMEIAAFDEPIMAQQALLWWLITGVVPDSSVLDEALAMANSLCRKWLHSFGWIKSTQHWKERQRGRDAGITR